MSIAVFLAASLGLAALALFLIARPLFEKPASVADDERADVLRARLDAVARDRTLGLIGEEAAAEAEIEAKRAALTAAPDVAAAKASRPLRFGAAVFLGIAPLAAAGLYLMVGAPALIDPPPAPAQTTAEAIAALPEDERRAMIEGMVASLSSRLEKESGDAEGWRMLARSQMVLERPADSAASYERLLATVEGDLDDWRNYASALAAASPEDRFPTAPEFLRALDEIEKRAPGDMMALFYRGGALREAGDAVGAARLWRELLAAMPADAPVRGTLEELIAEAEGAVLEKSVPK